jgi:hypothetical protein
LNALTGPNPTNGQAKTNKTLTVSASGRNPIIVPYSIPSATNHPSTSEPSKTTPRQAHASNNPTMGTSAQNLFESTERVNRRGRSHT